MDVIVSADKMLVFCRFYPPSDKGQLMTEEDIVKGLASHNIKEGIRQEEIRKFLKDHPSPTKTSLVSLSPLVRASFSSRKLNSE